MACARAYHPLTLLIFVVVAGMGDCSRSPVYPSDSLVHVPVDTVDVTFMQRHPEEAFVLLSLALARYAPSYEDTLFSLLNKVMASPGFSERLMGTLPVEIQGEPHACQSGFKHLGGPSFALGQVCVSGEVYPTRTTDRAEWYAIRFRGATWEFKAWANSEVAITPFSVRTTWRVHTVAANVPDLTDAANHQAPIAQCYVVVLYPFEVIGQLPPPLHLIAEFLKAILPPDTLPGPGKICRFEFQARFEGFTIKNAGPVGLSDPHRRKTDFEAGMHATTPRNFDAGSVSAGLTVY